MDGGEIMCVTRKDVAVVTGRVVYEFSVKEVFSDITIYPQFNTSHQQDVSEALI